MAVNENDKAFIEDQLSEFGEFQSKRMFGGVGFFKDGIMFAGIMHDKFRLKAGDTNRPDFEAKGMGPWEVPGKKMKMPYYEVPVEILEDKSELAKWANKAYEAAKRTKKK